MDASGYRFHIHFDRKPWSLNQGFFGFVGSLKPRKRGGSNIEKNMSKETKRRLINMNKNINIYETIYDCAVYTNEGTARIYANSIEDAWKQALATWTEVYDVQIMTVID